ncbi:nucleotidyltransferase [Metamycoplasma neophronis]|uniref:Nucleotidyltransferase n=1 Tax=Metamycoplasma neophronis TaxID=872983 RepID=A0ABY2YZQ1_9BACT|nr:nucleotidyltransferase [Metamycoplasma neophronis]TPR53850.1 nucleotidyltransferase [Metamycoplasma neophronis]
MKIGMVAEFNPFHNGHKYLIDKIKELYPGCELIVALSSDYVQRGEMACASFEDRKKIALKHGVDKVVEIDFFTSTQAAHIFSEGAIKILLREGIDCLAFGVSDTDDINKYINATLAIKSNLDTYNQGVKKNLKQGRSYVLSSYLSLGELIGQENIPADILGLEYTKTVVFNDLPIQLRCIKRTAAHNSLETNAQYASATKLRDMLKKGEDISPYSPMKVKIPFSRIEDKYPEFQRIVRESSAEELANIMLMSEGMENLFKKNIEAKDYDTFVDECTSKRYTKSRIKRVMLYTLLGIKKSQNN